MWLTNTGPESLASVLAEAPASIAEYSLIIAVDVDPSQLLQLSTIAWDRSIPFIASKSCGFYGSLRVQVKEMASMYSLSSSKSSRTDLDPVVETHPESLIDLRIHNPFPELIQFAKTFDYAQMDSAEHGHVPAVVILVKALEEWRAAVSMIYHC